MADRLTRRELTYPDSLTITTDQPTLAAVRRQSRELTRYPLKDWWDSNWPKRYADLDLDMRVKGLKKSEVLEVDNSME